MDRSASYSQAEMGKSPTMKINRNDAGRPGTDGYAIAVDHIEGDTRSDETRIKDESERLFQMVGILAPFPSFPEGIDLSATKDLGGSYIVVPERVVHVRLDTPAGAFQLDKNSRNELASVSADCRATGWRAAVGLFVQAISPYLDRLAYVGSVPIVFSKLVCTDVTNGVQVVSFRVPFAPVTLNPFEEVLYEPLFAIYALYREALASASNYYKFLCHYKILEGIFRRLRPELMKNARSVGIQISTRNENVPADQELLRFKPGYVGRSIPDLFETELTTEYRNAVAHFGLNDGRLLYTSDYSWATKFGEIVLVTEISAREVIGCQEDYYRQFIAAGGTLKPASA